MRATIGVLLLATVWGCGALEAQQRPHTYVLVHGAWGGGWDWRAVDSLLTLRGNRVVRVTLTGLGERSHLASAAIGLGTHVDDVVNAVLWEDLREVVLVGHSYGGMVVTGAADRIPERIRLVVYVDAFLPDSGESVLSLTNPSGAGPLPRGAREGMMVPGWVRDTTAIPRDVPHPLRTFTDTLRLVNPAARRVPGTYILTVESAATPDAFQRYADRAAARGWPVHRIQTGHNPQRTARDELVALLVGVP